MQLKNVVRNVGVSAAVLALSVAGVAQASADPVAPEDEVHACGSQMRDWYGLQLTGEGPMMTFSVQVQGSSSNDNYLGSGRASFRLVAGKVLAGSVTSRPLESMNGAPNAEVKATNIGGSDASVAVKDGGHVLTWTVGEFPQTAAFPVCKKGSARVKSAKLFAHFYYEGEGFYGFPIVVSVDGHVYAEKPSDGQAS